MEHPQSITLYATHLLALTSATNVTSECKGLECLSIGRLLLGYRVFVSRVQLDLIGRRNEEIKNIICMFLWIMDGGDYLSEESVLRSYPLYPTKKRRCCNVNGDGFTIITACFCIFTTALTIAFIAQLNYGSPQVTPHGAVSTDEEECSHVGITVMREGGSAVDVAIASILCMTVVHPHAVGPGGSGVMLVHDHKTNSSTVVDFMSGVPRSHRAEEDQPPPTDGRSIGVPGLLRGLEYAHTKFGKLPWRKLFQPSMTSRD
ncbi:glutathione hydrolase 7-like [Penaeus monodon]|uniref:glutathione hydrolase 7-like n=1 Tax=Penaeus monodon TaxID=6687 RepID=UPI0018A7B8FD|nr:glutathione hydrolase 7-like [Penaeus monodon]